MDKVINWIGKNDKKIFVISLITAVILFFFLNCITPYIIDDYCRMYDCSTLEEIKTVKDAATSIKTEYFTWSGRTLTLIPITFFVCIKNKMLFNFFNTAVYFLFLYLIMRLVNKSNKYKSLYFITLFVSFWLFTPAYGHNYLWLTGAIVYLWPVIPLILFLIPYLNSVSDKKTSKILLYSALPLGFLTGWSVENAAAAVFILLIAYYIRKIVIKEKLKTFEVLGTLAFLFGFVMLLMSPGSHNRSSQLTNGEAFSLFQFIKIIVKRAYYITFDSCKELSFLLIASSIVLFELIVQKKFKYIHFLYILAALASVYSMILSPVFPHRAYLFAVIFLIIFIFDGFSTVCIEEQAKRFIAAALLVCGIIFIHSFTVSTLDILNTLKRWNDRIIVMNTGKENGIYDYSFKIIHSGERHNSQWNLEDLNPYENIPIAKFFGINTIVGYE